MKWNQFQSFKRQILFIGCLLLAGILVFSHLTRQTDAAAYRRLSGRVASGVQIPTIVPLVQEGAPAPCAQIQRFDTPTGVPLTIPDGGGGGCILQVVTSTITISGAGEYLQDLNLQTFIRHPFCSDLHITLTSPQGTTATVTSKNAGGGPRANVFNGTVWDDQANPGGQVPYTNNDGLVTDRLYVTNVLASPLVPEEGFAVFRGENPNGVWTLTIGDDFVGPTLDGLGTLDDWSIELTSLASAPMETTSGVFANATPMTIPVPPVTGPNVVTSTINVASVTGFLSDITLTTDISHTRCQDLDITLTSPGGTVVTITTDNAGSAQNVWGSIPLSGTARQTVWSSTADNRVTNEPDGSSNCAGFQDGDFIECGLAGARCDELPFRSFRQGSGFFFNVYYNNGTVADHRYVTNELASLLTPEESFGVFDGEDPNGTWTLTISDDTRTSGGTLNNWSLQFITRDTADFNGCIELPVLYVADTVNHRIQTFDGAAWARIGQAGPGSLAGQFRSPEAVTASVDGQTIYVADTGNNRIQVSTDAGATWAVIATLGSALNQVRSPSGIALDTQGNLYIGDTGNNRVVRYTGGNFLQATILASLGSGPGQVRTPHGLVVDPNFRLFIADFGNKRVLRLDGANLETLMNQAATVATSGAAPNQVNAPQGVGTDNQGNLYVADTGNSRLLLFPGGISGPATVLATQGGALGQVRSPEGVTVTAFLMGDLAGGSSLIVGDTLNHRVQGRFLAGGAWQLVGVPNNAGSLIGQFRSLSKIR
ncbi:MAG TPA: proprotein convertase P-domain-containing protein [Acidobacteriota bacterium]|nr:proprotein convertase P-domain-containing protein [Acidobacteriota bacterium]